MVRDRVIRYTCAWIDGAPPPGAIMSGTSTLTKRAYRVISADLCRGKPNLGMVTYRIRVESMSILSGKREVEAGAPYWPIYWHTRKRKR